MNGKPAINTDRSIEAKPIVTSFDGFGMRRIFDVLSPTFRHTRTSKRFSSYQHDNLNKDNSKFFNKIQEKPQNQITTLTFCR